MYLFRFGLIDWLIDWLPFKQGLEQGIEQGIKQGIEQGIERGREKNKLENAKRMKDKGYPLEEIADITGLSIEEIEKL